MESSDEDFCLKWNDHHSTFFDSVEDLCSGNILTDVTLCAGSRRFAAHKLVLSICSSYFRDLFEKEKSGDKMVIYLKDVPEEELQLLLSYMYRGEINVKEETLVHLLQTARGLQIKGLTECQPNIKEEEQPKKMAPKRKQPPPAAIMDHPPPLPKIPLQQPILPPEVVTNPKRIIKEEDVIALEEVEPVFQEEISDDFDDQDFNEMDLPELPIPPPSSTSSNQMTPGNNYDTTDELNSTGQTNCPICHKSFASKSILKRHYNTHIRDRSYACPICKDKSFSRTDSLRRHFNNVHNNFSKQEIENILGVPNSNTVYHSGSPSAAPQ